MRASSGPCVGQPVRMRANSGTDLYKVGDVLQIAEVELGYLGVLVGREMIYPCYPLCWMRWSRDAWEVTPPSERQEQLRRLD